MLNEKRLRLLTFLIVALIHILLIFFLAFNMNVNAQTPAENAKMMKLTDLTEIIPEPEVELPKVESIAETMIETEDVPDQQIVAPGTIITTPSWDDYLPIHKVSDPPRFNERDIYADLVYPPIALRSGIEGRVILELFIDRNGHVQQILILQENPQERGFGEAAVKAFTGKRGTPAFANGEPVSSRYRYPVSFKIK
jgi:protein TonB